MPYSDPAVKLSSVNWPRRNM